MKGTNRLTTGFMGGVLVCRISIMLDKYYNSF